MYYFSIAVLGVVAIIFAIVWGGRKHHASPSVIHFVKKIDDDKDGNHH